MKRSGPSRATVRSPISRPFGLNMGERATRPCSGRRPASSRSSHASAPGPGNLVLAVVGDLEDAHAFAHRPAFPADRLVSVRAAEGRHLVRLDASGREP